jgi:hypothetical protein
MSKSSLISRFLLFALILVMVFFTGSLACDCNGDDDDSGAGGSNSASENTATSTSTSTSTLTSTNTSTSTATQTLTSTSTATETNTSTSTATSTSTVTPQQNDDGICLLSGAESPDIGEEFGSFGQITFTWFEQSGAAAYHLTLSYPDGSSALFESDTPSLNFYLASFPMGGDYSWQVIALDSNGDEICVQGPYPFSKEEKSTETPTSTATNDENEEPPDDEIPPDEEIPPGEEEDLEQ